MTNNDMFELMFGFRLPNGITCTIDKDKCPQSCPFSYKCKTWLDKEFVVSNEILKKMSPKFVPNKDTQLVFGSDFEKIIDRFNEIGCTSFIPTAEELIKIKEKCDEEFRKDKENE